MNFRYNYGYCSNDMMNYFNISFSDESKNMIRFLKKDVLCIRFTSENIFLIETGKEKYSITYTFADKMKEKDKLIWSLWPYTLCDFERDMEKIFYDKDYNSYEINDKYVELYIERKDV